MLSVGSNLHGGAGQWAAGAGGELDLHHTHAQPDCLGQGGLPSVILTNPLSCINT